jgi:hypothetical protein
MLKSKTSLALLALLLTSSCSVQSRNTFSSSKPEPDLVQADSWDFMTIVIGGARTKLENNGHFSTVPNACYRRESGALELALWNRVANATNRMLTQQWLDEPICSARPAGSPDLYGPVLLQMMDRQTREILSPQGSKYCTRSVDVEAAGELLLALGEVAHRASIEGCQPRRSLIWSAEELALPGSEDRDSTPRPRRPHEGDDQGNDDDSNHDDHGQPGHHPKPHPRPTPTPTAKPGHHPHRPEQKGKQEDSDDWHDSRRDFSNNFSDQDEE